MEISPLTTEKILWLLKLNNLVWEPGCAVFWVNHINDYGETHQGGAETQQGGAETQGVAA